jgi:cell division protein FtsB
VLAGAVLLFVAVLAIAGTKSFRDLQAARQHRHHLETEIEQTRTEIARLRSRIESLRSDPGALERRAREDLGMVRPGDVVIELPLDPPPLKPGAILPAPALPDHP